jgi:hypothetical protein
LREFAGKPVRAFAVWEPVLPTDWASPSTTALRRISDSRASQFWDRGRLISRSMGEHDRRSVVWDYIAVYPAGAIWRPSAKTLIATRTGFVSQKSAVRRQTVNMDS